MFRFSGEVISSLIGVHSPQLLHKGPLSFIDPLLSPVKTIPPCSPYSWHTSTLVPLFFWRFFLLRNPIIPSVLSLSFFHAFPFFLFDKDEDVHAFSYPSFLPPRCGFFHPLWFFWVVPSYVVVSAGQSFPPGSFLTRFPLFPTSMLPFLFSSIFQRTTIGLSVHSRLHDFPHSSQSIPQDLDFFPMQRRPNSSPLNSPRSRSASSQKRFFSQLLFFKPKFESLNFFPAVSSAPLTPLYGTSPSDFS